MKSAKWWLVGVALAALGASAADYVVAVDQATWGDPAWKAVAEALKAKHSAELVTYASSAALEQLLPALRKCAPRFVCFVAKPENAGRDLVVNAAQVLRRIDDDPWGDAQWGILTGYAAADAMRVVKAPREREIKRVATSLGNPGALDGWEAGFASDEGNRNNLWFKRPGGATEHRDTGGDPAQALAEMYNSIPVDYLTTSGHASERDWQIIYNQNAGNLVHDGEGRLVFKNPQGERFPLTQASVKAYVAAGNCLIGHIDRPSCMTTAWFHSGGLEQMVGYTAVTFYGFQGWGTKSLFEGAAGSLAECYFLQNQILQWAVGQREAKLRTTKNGAKLFDDTRLFVTAHAGELQTQDEMGLLWDRDVVAFYGDPAQRISYPQARRNVRVECTATGLAVRFEKDVEFGPLNDVKSARPVAAMLRVPPPKGAMLVDAQGKVVQAAVLDERFAIIPLAGRHPAGEKLAFRYATIKK